MLELNAEVCELMWTEETVGALEDNDVHRSQVDSTVWTYPSNLIIVTIFLLTW